MFVGPDQFGNVMDSRFRFGPGMDQIMSDSFYTSLLAFRTSIIFTFSHFSLEKKTKITFITVTRIFFFALRVTQTAV